MIRHTQLLLFVLVVGSPGLASCTSSRFSATQTANPPRFVKRQSLEERAISEATGARWAISTQGRASTRAAERMYAAGGNIIDAAIAASFTISVERPHSTGLGGGGFFLYREAKSGQTYAIDFRERAPSSARKDIFLDRSGNIVLKKSTLGRHAVAVPGLVRGLIEVHRRFGVLPLKQVIQPAIELARSGVRVYPTLAEAMVEEQKALSSFPASARIFLRRGKVPLKEGEVLIQKDLAESLKRVADSEGEDFYTGRIASAITRSTRGWISAEDLKNYRVQWRTPIESPFGPYRVISMPPPSSGGTHLVQMLNMLDHARIGRFPMHSADSVHRMATAMQFAFLERARYMADPDFHPVPLATLLSAKHARELWKTFDSRRVRSSKEVSDLISVLPEHAETTHLSIMDAEGNAVASTQTINGWFGSGMVVPGTGILLNNEMDDFSAKPGASNLFGAIGSSANAVEPGKTPLSSMTPTIILEGSIPRLSIGAPGGTRIITCVAQSIVNYLVYGNSLYDTLNSVRFHQQWKPDELIIESPGLGDAVENRLRQIGWDVKRKKVGCAVMAVAREGKRLRAVSDPRDHGMAAASTDE